MKKAVSLLLALFLLLSLSSGLSETRQGIIAREGQEEVIEETLFESWHGFSFWYAEDWLDANYDEKDGIEGVVVETLYSDDFMVLSVIPEEDAVEYTEDLGVDIVDLSTGSRVQMDVYHDLEDGRYYFLTLIAENGRYIRAIGEYAAEAAEGNAKFLQKVLDSVTFEPGCLIRADWGSDTPDAAGYTLVILTAMGPVKDAKLLWLGWNEENYFLASWTPYLSLGDLSARQSMAVMLEFIGDMPNNGIQYTDEEGITYTYGLDIGGEDGLLYFWRLTEADEEE